MPYGTATESKLTEIVEACERSGKRSIIALSGVPGTGKSFLASIAAQRFANEPLRVREIQFHQSFSYEEFMEGLRIDETGVQVVPGVFLDMNERAHDDPTQKYVLLIEELTRANLPAVLGELLTYLEHRERHFLTVYSRKPVRVAENLVVLATFNPTDRSALELDNALMRRIRVISCAPSAKQLAEMLQGSHLAPAVVSKLEQIFLVCQERFEQQFDYLMPFGHGIFADVDAERPDLYKLWAERIQYLLHRPLLEAHPFADVIRDCYPWRNPEYQVG